MYPGADGRAAVKQMRVEPRMKVLLAGELRGPRGPSACRITDLSRGGACVEVEVRFSIGEEVTLARGSLEVGGVVAWVSGRRCGLCFRTPIRATELLVQMSHSRQAAVSSGGRRASGPSPSR